MQPAASDIPYPFTGGINTERGCHCKAGQKTNNKTNPCLMIINRKPAAHINKRQDQCHRHRNTQYNFICQTHIGQYSGMIQNNITHCKESGQRKDLENSMKGNTALHIKAGYCYNLISKQHTGNRNTADSCKKRNCDSTEKLNQIFIHELFPFQPLLKCLRICSRHHMRISIIKVYPDSGADI